MVLSYEAIGNIHKSLDNDKDGEVDPSETDKFLRREFSLSERATKSRSLAEDDLLVSLNDLWTLWKKNPAFKWTVKQTARWLTDHVELAQYEELFARHNIDGKSIPLLAMQNMSYLADVLLIRNPIHKRKLMLKALDTILFGPPQQHGFLTVRDPVFTAATFGLIGALLVLAATVRAYLLPFVNGKSFIALPDSGVASNEEALRQMQQRLDHLEQLRSKLNNADHTASKDGHPPYSKDNPKGHYMRNAARKSTYKLASGNKPKSVDSTKQKIDDAGNTTTDDVLQIAMSCNAPTEADYDSAVFVSPDNITRHGKLADEALRHSKSNRETKWTLGSSNANAIDSPPSMFRSDSDSSLHCGALEKTDRPIMMTNQELILLLQMSHQMEMQYFKMRKLLVEKQLTEVRTQCIRLHRKRYNILGSVRLLHSDDFEDLEKRMLVAKLTLEHLQDERNDLLDRYARIEALTGLPVRGNMEIDKLRTLLTPFKNPKDIVSLSSWTPTTCGISENHLQHTFTQHRNPRQQSSGSLLANLGVPWTSCDTEASATRANSTALDILGTKTYQRYHSSKPGLPRNYSFVRPFATLWRKKAGSQSLKSTLKNT